MPIPLLSSFFAVFYLIWIKRKNQDKKKEGLSERRPEQKLSGKSTTDFSR